MFPENKTIYLTFDDGPHPTITPFVLDQLRQYKAKATFFCIGKNVVLYPDVYKTVLAEGHATGNHTYHHLNGWKTTDNEYLTDIEQASSQIKSHLFRPPYGRIRKSQLNRLLKNGLNASANPEIENRIPSKVKIIMWSVLSGDFDQGLTPEKCLNNVINNAKSGSVIVFHDSEKAYHRLQYALPKLLKYYSEKGYVFERIN